MDIRLDPELERLLTQSAEEAGREPSALLDDIVRRHLAEQWFEREVRPAYERAGRGESIPFDRETFIKEQNERLRDVIARAKP